MAFCNLYEDVNEWYKKINDIMPPSIFNVGDRVERIEDREIVGATVLTIVIASEYGNQENSIEIEYDEGGTGWWPESSLRLISQA
jgi:hypothetical protein